VPGMQVSALARFALPPRERVPCQQRHPEGASRPLAAPAEKLGIEAASPAGQVAGIERFGPPTQLLAPRGIERGLAEQSVRQRADVQASSTHDDRPASSGAGLGDPSRGVARESSCAVTLSRRYQIESAVRNARSRRAIGLRGTDIEAAIDLAGVGGGARDWR